MKKTIELTKETYAGIENNKKVPGVIYLDHETGRLVFKAFNRNKKRGKRLRHGGFAAAASKTIAAGGQETLTITAPSGARRLRNMLLESNRMN